MYKFAAACKNELIVFGASRPGYSEKQIKAWIEFMNSQGIQRVCCLLAEKQLIRYPKLLDSYKLKFGTDNVCWAAIADFEICDFATLHNQILPFLFTSDQYQQKTVVHCSGGIGRTGQILAVASGDRPTGLLRGMIGEVLHGLLTDETTCTVEDDMIRTIGHGRYTPEQLHLYWSL